MLSLRDEGSKQNSFRVLARPQPTLLMTDSLMLLCLLVRCQASGLPTL